MASRDPCDRVAGEVASGSQRAVGLQRDPVLAARLEQSLAVLIRAELHLIHDRRDRRGGEQLPQLAGAEVRDSDRPRIAGLPRLLHPGPRPGRAALGPVDDVQIDVVDPEPLQAALGLGDRVLPPREELRGDEHLPAGDAALAQPLAHAFLVAVRLGRVDVPVP